MILSKKRDLLESDFSMCLGTLMSYKEPDSVLLILKMAQQVRLAILDGHHFDREDSPVQQ